MNQSNISATNCHLSAVHKLPSALERRAANFSMRRFVEFAIEGPDSDAGREIEAYEHEELVRAGYVPRSSRSRFIPAFVLKEFARRSQNYQTTVAGSGAELVESTLSGSLLIDALRPRSVVLQLGAQTVGGLKGNAVIPRLSTASAANWVTSTGTSPVNSGAIPEVEGTFDNSQLVVPPASLGAYGKMSRQLYQQTGQLADATFTDDILNCMGTAVDMTAQQGTGAGGQPVGVINTTGVTMISGAAASYSVTVGAAAAVVNANATVNRSALGWSANPNAATVLAQRPKIAGFPQFLWDGNIDTGAINSHRALSTNNCPAGTAIFGDWSQLMVLSWGDDAPVELEFNQYSNFASGDLQFRAFMSCNLLVRHPQSFCVVSGIT